MAATTAARRLTEAHRLAQARLGVQTVLTMNDLWPLLDPENLDATFDRWLNATLPVIDGHRSASARLSANYVTTYKQLELGAGATPVQIVLADPAPVEAVSTSLLVTGPVSAKSAVARAVPLTQAMDTAQAQAAAAAMRHVLNGGRDTISRTVASDRQALGWARVTSGVACAFCAMLASRGAVYSKKTGDFEAHDHCTCTVEPQFRRDSRIPATSERWAALWKQAKDVDPRDTAGEFRRLITAGA